MNIKKIFVIALLVIVAGNVQAQSAGINTPGIRMTLAQKNVMTTPATGLMIYQTDGTPGFYYNSGTPETPVWSTVGGSGLPAGIDGQVLQMIGGVPTWVNTIGMTYGGGIIFYILHSNDLGYDPLVQHGLIAAPSDQNGGIGIIWGCDGVALGVTTQGTAIGTGQANTTAIVIGCGDVTAAKSCDNLSNGYTDWYLPSRDELNQLYLNRDLIGGFAEVSYWSSSEYGDPELSATGAICQFFASGNKAPCTKGGAANVRAIRSF